METGMIRPIDDLGRIVIPKEIRKAMHIQDGTCLEIISNVEQDIIRLRPVRLQCVCCGSRNEAALREKNGVLVCLECLDTMLGDVPAAAKGR